MDKSISFLTGLATTVIAWVILIICDMIDEIGLGKESLISFWMCVVVPVAMLVVFIIHYLKRKPSPLNIALWFAGFLPLGLASSVALCIFVTNQKFFVSNRCFGCYFMCTNGLEYIFYAISVFGAFTALSLVFVGIAAIVRGVKGQKLE